MDIISHAIAGASVGFHYGNPILGAIIGVLPDCVLGVKRVQYPTWLYNHTHSLYSIALAAFVFWLNTHSLLMFFALLSHIILDIPTHGETWAPPLLYPFSEKRFSLGDEWEWFSTSWFTGLILTFIWSFLWINM